MHTFYLDEIIPKNILDSDDFHQIYDAEKDWFKKQKSPKRELIPQEVLDLAEKLDFDISNPFQLHHINQIFCGFHSGFPPCCISFFVKEWIPNLDGHYKGHSLDEHRENLRSSRCGYVPCPDCFASKNFVKVKRCLCSKLRYPAFLIPKHLCNEFTTKCCRE